MTMQSEPQKGIRFSTTAGQLLLLGAAVILPGVTSCKSSRATDTPFCEKAHVQTRAKRTPEYRREATAAFSLLVYSSSGLKVPLRRSG